jgi:glycosyltransferase involved in cell wall biosynthesis
MTSPLVSVVIAAYNAARYLPETLESALAQTHAHREIIVIDDGSTDETAARVASYRSRVTYIRRAHGGLAAARNAGLRMVRGDYIALLDADDLWKPEKLEVQLDVARRHPESGLIACDGVQFDGEAVLDSHLLGRALARALDASPGGEITGHFHRAFLEGSTIACPAQTLIPRRVMEELGPFVDSGAQDYDYYLRISQRFPLSLHGHSLVRWRYRPDSLSGPLERRHLVWPLDTLSVLRAHAARCNVHDRRLVAERVATLTREVAVSACMTGTGKELVHATRFIARLFWARPWPPTALLYLPALWTPPALRGPLARGLRALGWDWRRRPSRHHGYLR